MDSNQWQIATEFKKATDADPHSQSPVISLQSNPFFLNPHIGFGRKRFAVKPEAAGLGFAAAGHKIRPGNILVCYYEHKRKRDPLLLPTNSDKREEEGGEEEGGGEEDVTSGLGLRKPRARARARPFLARVAFCSAREDCRSSLETLPYILRALFVKHYL